MRKIGTIGRFRPLHNGGAAMLETLCELADEVIIGIGSSNKYNSRNPFTYEETKQMIDSHLSERFGNYSFVEVPDFAHIPEYNDGQKWKEFVVQSFGDIDAFVSGNDYVFDLLKDKYNVVKPHTLVPRERWTPTRGAQVRRLMAYGGGWEEFVPQNVSKMIMENRFDERFRREFGLEVISELSEAHLRSETAREEYLHTTEN